LITFEDFNSTMNSDFNVFINSISSLSKVVLQH